MLIVTCYPQHCEINGFLVWPLICIRIYFDLYEDIAELVPFFLSKRLYLLSYPPSVSVLD